MTDSQVEALVESFNSIDTNKSGFIDQRELERAMYQYVQNPNCPAEYKSTHSHPGKIKEEVAKFMRQIDTNGDRKISLQEFIDYYKK